MTSATLTLSSRPKVHRLPALPQQPTRKFHIPNALIGFAAIVSIASVGISLTHKSEEISRKDADAATQLTLAPVGPAADKSGSDTIVIKGETGGIVGQMAKIPTPNVQLTEIQSVSTVDKASGRELLSIVNKH